MAIIQSDLRVIPTTVIQTTHGNITIPGRSAKINVLAVLPFDDKVTVLPTAIHTIAGKSIRVPTCHTMSRQGVQDNGAWYFSLYPEVVDGSLLVVQVSITKNGKPYSDGMIVVRTRKDASLYRIQTTLFHTGMSAIDEPNVNIDGYYGLDVLTGNFDIIEPEEYSKWGIKFKDQLINRFCNKDEIDEIFYCHSLQESKTTLSSLEVVNSDGESIIIPEIKSKRRIITVKRR